MNIGELEKKTITELHKLARELDVTGYAQMRKKDLIFALLKKETEKGGNIFAESV
ncbi:MAG: Rho termination factor N-terminal domain-containing protein, partial [Halanaerobiaceae bacterium]